MLAPPPAPRIRKRPLYLKFAGNKNANDEWIRTFADGRNVKFSQDELIDATFITAQIEGNEVVYSILLSKAEAKLNRKEVERRFARELSKK